MADTKKFDEMIKLEGKTKDAQAQETFKAWYDSLSDAERAEFEAYKKKQMKLGCGIVLAIVLALGVYGMFFYEPQQPPKPAPTKQVEQQETAKPALTGEEADKAEIASIAKNSVKSADYKDITITKIVDADRYNVVLLLKGQDNLTTNMIYTGYKMSCEEGFKGLYTSSMGQKINDVKISISTEMVNTQTGAKSEAVIYMLAMTRERANQMHWENIASVDIEKAATEKYMHPALKRDLQKK